MNNTREVNLYDFDHTIYKGDSSFDFIVYSMVRTPRAWRLLPKQLVELIYYVFGQRTRKQIKQVAFGFLSYVDDIDLLLKKFWNSHYKKISVWYLNQKKREDIIISASPDFLLTPVAKELGFKLLATRMDQHTGTIIGENCRGAEKVKRLNELTKTVQIGKVFSDNLSDKPLFSLSKEAYIVKGNNIIPLESFTHTAMDKFKTRGFFRFLLVGIFNAFIGVALAYIYSFIINEPRAAFVIGYFNGLIFSYFLNSAVTFKNYNYSFAKFLKFCFSYIPNFLILLFTVHILIGYFGLYRLIAYILAVAFAVPVTFLLLSNITFKKDSL